MLDRYEIEFPPGKGKESNKNGTNKGSGRK